MAAQLNFHVHNLREVGTDLNALSYEADVQVTSAGNNGITAEAALTLRTPNPDDFADLRIGGNYTATFVAVPRSQPSPVPSPAPSPTPAPSPSEPVTVPSSGPSFGQGASAFGS